MTRQVNTDEDIIRHLIRAVGDDPTREGLQETPARVMKAWRHWCSGYGQDGAAVLKTFKDGAEQCRDEMVVVRDLHFYSTCEHHMAPFFGVAHVAYIPDGCVVGLSKFARVVDVYARRLQVQERLTNEIANCIEQALQPLGVGVIIHARHFCMCSRGVGQQRSVTVTSALRGAIKDNPETRSELMMLTAGTQVP